MFFIIFLAFGLSFWCLLEIILPTGLIHRADQQADKGGWRGIFFTASTLVLVSFSYIGPIVVNILRLSVRGETLLPVMGMPSFSLAFALPFTREWYTSPRDKQFKINLGKKNADL